jgi:LPXTG-site transpeptidase (sortase) family protein
MTSKRFLEILSKSLLVLGAVVILVGMAWTAWQLWQESTVPVHAAAGAVVAAETSDLPVLPPPVAAGASPEPSASPDPLSVPGYAPRLPAYVSERAALPPTPLPTATPSPTPTPPPDPPTRIVAPAIKLDAKVVPTGYRLVKKGGRLFTEWLVPKNAAGWHKTSAPAGQPGNTVISGHHNIDGKVFRYVVNLKPGDKITLYAGSKSYTYVVVERYILKEAGMPLSVREKNAQWIAPTNDTRLTLVTCWPYYWPGNSHRVVVVARPDW